MLSITELMLVVFAINLPFGYWRCRAAKFSRQWMMAVHIPVPIVFLIRVLSGFGWTVIPLIMLSFAAGQFTGGHLRKIVA